MRRVRCAHAHSRRLHRGVFIRTCGCAVASLDESGGLVLAAGDFTGAAPPGVAALRWHRETSQVCSCSWQASPQEHIYWDLRLYSCIARQVRCARARGRRLQRSAFTTICCSAVASGDESGVLVPTAGVSRGVPLPGFAAVQPYRETSQVCSCSEQASP